jgi:hypothetical protein
VLGRTLFSCLVLHRLRLGPPPLHFHFFDLQSRPPPRGKIMEPFIIKNTIVIVIVCRPPFPPLIQLLGWSLAATLPAHLCFCLSPSADLSSAGLLSRPIWTRREGKRKSLHRSPEAHPIACSGPPEPAYIPATMTPSDSRASVHITPKAPQL